MLPKYASTEYLQLMLDWRRSDLELTRAFQEWLRAHRPLESEKNKGGRKQSVSDMLNQLAAYRLEARGLINEAQQLGFRAYTSEGGRKRSVLAAKARLYDDWEPRLAGQAATLRGWLSDLRLKRERKEPDAG